MSAVAIRSTTTITTIGCVTREENDDLASANDKPHDINSCKPLIRSHTRARARANNTTPGCRADRRTSNAPSSLGRVHNGAAPQRDSAAASPGRATARAARAGGPAGRVAVCRRPVVAAPLRRAVHTRAGGRGGVALFGERARAGDYAVANCHVRDKLPLCVVRALALAVAVAVAVGFNCRRSANKTKTESTQLSFCPSSHSLPFCLSVVPLVDDRYKAELTELRQQLDRSNQAFAGHGFQSAEAAAVHHRQREAAHAATKEKLAATAAEVVSLNERLATLAHEKDIAVLELEKQVCAATRVCLRVHVCVCAPWCCRQRNRCIGRMLLYVCVCLRLTEVFATWACLTD